MRKIIFSICCLLPFWQCIYANDKNAYNLFREKMENIFEYVDKSQIPTGLLSDYGLKFIYPDSYNGVVCDSNYVSRVVWEMLYAGLYDSRINGKCQMQTPDEVYKQAEGNLSILYYKYNTFAEDALERGLVTFEDEKIRIVPGMPSPYVEKECFAVVPEEGTLPYVFDKNNFFTNTGLDVTKIEYKIGNGNYGVIPISSGMSHRVPVNTPGEYDITFRVTFSSGKTMESHSIITVPQEKANPEKAKDNYGIATLGIINADYSQYGGAIQVKYMKNSPAKGKLVRPLIIVEDMDLSALSSKLEIDLSGLLSQGGGIGDAIDQLSQLYDIIYVDFNDGLDDLLRNAEMLHKALVMVNQNRYDKFSDESYIVGLGTGGVLARMAVNMMEKANEDHKVQKIISINSPFKGINIPLGLQSLIWQIYNAGDALNLASGQLKKTATELKNVLDSDVMKQMLVYSIDENFKYRNDHTLFYQGNNLISELPKKCESINISLGDDYSDKLHLPYQLLFDSNQAFNFKKAWIFFKADVRFNCIAYTLPSKKEMSIYDGRLYIYTRFLFFKSETDISHYITKSTNDMYPIDCISGTYVNIDSLSNDIALLNTNIDKFCFVPTFSALDLDAEKYFATDDLEDLRGEMNADRAYWTGSNGSYADFSGILDILMQELAPTIKGETRNVLGDIVLTADNFIDLPLGIRYDWKFRNGKFKVVSQNGAEAVVRPLEYSGAKDYVSVTATPTVDIPGLSGMKVTFPEREITSEKIEIEGLESISRMDNYYALSALPSDGCTVDWTCSSGLRVEKAMEEAALAYVEEFSDDAWIEATLHHGDTEYKFHKDLICARIDSIRFSLEQKVWNRTSKSYKYGFRIKLYPEDIDLELIDFCWGNSVHIYNKSDGSRVDSARPGSMLRGSYGGIASIKTDGDVAPCSMKLDDWHDTIMVIDTIAILNPYPGIGIDYGGVHPTSVVEPGGDPIGLDDIVMYGKNCAVVTMPGVSSEEYAAGDIICDITDDFGTKYHVTYTMQSSWTPVYNCSVSPNPAGERLDVKMTVEGDPAAVTADEPVTALLYSGTGLVAKETFADIRSGGSLDVSHLTEGTYYLNIEVNGTVVDRQVVLIQR